MSLNSPVSWCTDGTEQPPQAEERVQSVKWCQSLERKSVTTMVVGGGRWVWEVKSMCGGGNKQSPHRDAKLRYRQTERGRELFTRLKGKRIPLFIRVRSKNNSPFLSAAHWGRLVKESVSEEGASKSCRGPNRMKSQSEREGLKQKRSTRGKAHRGTAKKGRARVDSSRKLTLSSLGSICESPLKLHRSASWIRFSALTHPLCLTPRLLLVLVQQ